MIKLGLIVRRFKSRHLRRQCENTVYSDDVHVVKLYVTVVTLPIGEVKWTHYYFQQIDKI